jgi:hypothetical protein
MAEELKVLSALLLRGKELNEAIQTLQSLLDG